MTNKISNCRIKNELLQTNGIDASAFARFWYCDRFFKRISTFADAEDVAALSNPLNTDAWSDVSTTASSSSFCLSESEFENMEWHFIIL